MATISTGPTNQLEGKNGRQSEAVKRSTEMRSD